jgi:spore germination cell wall hydrolase CwlJ-like protein
MATTDLTGLVYGDDSDADTSLPPQPQIQPGASVASTLGAAATAGTGGIGSDARYPVAPPMGWNAPPLNNVDRDAMIKTIVGEAGGEPALGQAAVAHVILNRAALGGYGPNQSIQSVAEAPNKPGSSFHQFSVWNAPGMADYSKITHTITPADPQYQAIGKIVDQVYSGAIPDPTGGATHYYAPASMPGGRPPPWAAALARLNSTRIGGNVFVGGSEGEGRVFPISPPIRTAFNAQGS